MPERKKRPVAGIAIAVVATLLITQAPGMFKSEKAEHPDVLRAKSIVVRRGRLKISLVEHGSLRASKHHHIKPPFRHSRNKLAWVIDEGAQVKKGDSLLKFETKGFVDQLEKTRRNLESARQKLLMEEENLKIQESAGKSLVADAEARYEVARTMLTRFREIDAPQKFKEVEKSVDEARTKLREAERQLKELQHNQEEQLFVEDSQRAQLENRIDTAAKGVRAAKGALSTAKRRLKMFRSHEYRDDLKDKEQSVANALLSMRKAKVSAKSQLLQQQTSVKGAMDNIGRLKKAIEKLGKDIEKCDVKSPAPGIVLYGQPNLRSHGFEVKMGKDYWGHQTMLTIPDSSIYEVDIAVGERYRSRIKPGCSGEVSFEAISDLSMKGTLIRISSLARGRNRHDDGSPQVFDGVVALAGSDPRMISGMTTRVEIVCEELEDVLYVPVESLFNEDGAAVCYVHSDGDVERREVEYGKSSDSFVEIVGGLEEGERILVVRPPQAGGEETEAPEVNVPGAPVPNGPPNGSR